jgi:hypothetical protein
VQRTVQAGPCSSSASAASSADGACRRFVRGLGVRVSFIGLVGLLRSLAQWIGAFRSILDGEPRFWSLSAAVTREDPERSPEEPQNRLQRARESADETGPRLAARVSGIGRPVAAGA